MALQVKKAASAADLWCATVHVLCKTAQMYKVTFTIRILDNRDYRQFRDMEIAHVQIAMTIR